MGCTSCSTKGGCSTGQCGQMGVFDWLSDMAYPSGFDAVEVKFKGGRKGFYRNSNNLYLATGDAVVIESSPGHHIGTVSAQGEIVRLQMKKKKVTYNEDLPIIYREATEKDLEKFRNAQNRELTTLFRSREIIQDLKLAMKLSDIEFQADNTKAIFFYSADDRVDFRELIKLLASEFKVRIEMKQISLRHEAGRLGGIGSCGRELCCSTWLTDFKSVTTGAARYQNLSLNPSKLSGQCGRLKCCLNYELETYIEALKKIPDAPYLKTKQGKAKLQKTDIFKKILWYGFEDQSDWIALPAKRVDEIVMMNEKGEEPFDLEMNQIEVVTKSINKNSDLEKLDSKYKVKKKRKPQHKKRKPQSRRSNKPNDQK